MTIEDLQGLMPIYYSRLFPFKKFIHFLSRGSSNLPQREFSFTIRNGQQEIYIRFQSYLSKQEFKQDVIRKCPEKIDIGAIYSGKPKMKNSLKIFKPLQRELVFDIDMTDYDEIRTCCKGADICCKCWKYMTVAIKILDYCLRDCFGFKHILYVFSGRRGIHCWIADDRALDLTEESRKAIVNFMELIKGGDQKAKKVFVPTPIHPFVANALQVVSEYFEIVVLKEQNVLMNPEMEAKMLEIMPSDVRNDVGKIWNTLSSSKAKWKLFVEYMARSGKHSNLIKEIMLQYMYPRLDSQVSMHLNHLLKAPFCVHPKTGKVCVPIDIKDCDTFNPLTVPTVSSLIEEINTYDHLHPNEIDPETGKKLPDWKKTGIKCGIEIFNGFLEGIDEEKRRVLAIKRVEEDLKLQF